MHQKPFCGTSQWCSMYLDSLEGQQAGMRETQHLPSIPTSIQWEVFLTLTEYPGNIKKTRRFGTWGHGLGVDLAVFHLWSDYDLRGLFQPNWFYDKLQVSRVFCMVCVLLNLMQWSVVQWWRNSHVPSSSTGTARSGASISAADTLHTHLYLPWQDGLRHLRYLASQIKAVRRWDLGSAATDQYPGPCTCHQELH